MEPVSVEWAQRVLPELEQIVSFRPTAKHVADLATVYFTLGRPQDAVVLFDKSWRVHKHVSVAMNMALALKALGRHVEALQWMEAAYELEPSDDYVRLGYGEALLHQGFWRQAWPIYDNARPTQQGQALNLHLPMCVKEWMGQPLPKDKILLVANEGGTGDRVSYARWLPKLTEMGINWKFYPYQELFSLFERVFPKDRLVADNSYMDDPAYWTTTFSLPAKLGASPTNVPAPLAITARPDLVEKYKITNPNGLPLVGICYEAAEQHQGGLRVRSMSEGQAMRLVTQTAHRVNWINLQYGRSMPFPVNNISFSTWEETAALMHNLDAVVSVDTSVMHVAGALGKPLAVLLSGNSCWKFLYRTPRCVWYPTAKLYRNEEFGMEKAIDKLVLDILKNRAFQGPNV